MRSPIRALSQRTTDRNHDTIERLIQAINDQNIDEMDRLFIEDSVMEYPQSGERIVGGENRRAIYGSFDTLPMITPRRMRSRGDLVILEAEAAYPDTEESPGKTYHAVFIFEMHEGRIARETAYWAESFEAPEWRRPWTETA